MQEHPLHVERQERDLIKKERPPIRGVHEPDAVAGDRRARPGARAEELELEVLPVVGVFAEVGLDEGRVAALGVQVKAPRERALADARLALKYTVQALARGLADAAMNRPDRGRSEHEVVVGLLAVAHDFELPALLARVRPEQLDRAVEALIAGGVDARGNDPQ